MYCFEDKNFSKSLGTAIKIFLTINSNILAKYSVKESQFIEVLIR